MQNQCENEMWNVRTESAADGLVLSLTNLGKVDIPYIASITGIDCDEVIESLKGAIYQNPEIWKKSSYKGWETADEYLSGNLFEKLKTARQANDRYPGRFTSNIDALKKLKPKAISEDEIYVTLGTPWIPTDVIDDFIEYICGNPLSRWAPGTDKKIFRTVYEPITGTWELPLKNRYGKSIAVTSTYGTRRMGALYILEKTLNTMPISIKVKVDGLETKLIDKVETTAVLEKQQKMVHVFKEWIWTDSKRTQRLKAIYNEKFGYIRKRQFDGSFL